MSMHDRHGAKQRDRFDPAKAAVLEDPARFAYLPAEDVEALLASPASAVAVDFGAGTGAYARALARRRPDVRFIAWEEQPRMLDLLREKLAAEPLANVEPLLADETSLETLRGRADRVLALNVPHELGDRALEVLGSLLKPDGQAVFIDWDAATQRPVGPPRDHVLDADQAKDRLSRFGWTVASERRFPYHYALVCRLRR